MTSIFCFAGSRVMSPVSTAANTGGAAALHQLPSVLAKPKVLTTVSNGGLANGQAHVQIRQQGTDGKYTLVVLVRLRLEKYMVSLYPDV